VARAASPLAGFGPELAQLLVVSMWASTFVVTKAAFAEISPMAFIFVRFALMTLLAFGVLAARGRKAQWRIRRADLPRFIMAGLAGYTLYQLGFVLGLDNTSPFSSSLLIAMVPFFTMLILAVMGERTPLGAWAGLGIGIVGVIIFLADKQGGSGTLLGDALSLGAAVSFAFYGVINRPLVRAYPPETYTAYAVGLGAIPLLILSTPAAVAQPWGAITFWGWVAIIYMVTLPVYVAYMLWNWAIARRVYALELGHRAAGRGGGHQFQPAGAGGQRHALGYLLQRGLRAAQTAGRGLRAGRAGHVAEPGADPGGAPAGGCAGGGVGAWRAGGADDQRRVDAGRGSGALSAAVCAASVRQLLLLADPATSAPLAAGRAGPRPAAQCAGGPAARV
jgi:drug/metabolite transporter (DMT)-like permease